MDLIDRAAVQYKMLEILPESDNLEWYGAANPDEIKDLVDEMYNIVLNVNRIDAEPVKHGRWILRSDKPDEYNNIRCDCSRCGAGDVFNINVDVPYCWSCGAKMNIKEEETT